MAVDTESLFAHWSGPLVMGVLNVTPDSFSDGGEFTASDAALHRASRMLAEGAAIIDVGGESTRPGAQPVSADEELDRVVPVIKRIAAETDAILSVDTSKPEVMREAVHAGASIVNDIWALRRTGSLETVAELDCVVCLMHMLGEPATMQNAPVYDEIPRDIVDFLARRIRACVDGGIAVGRIIVDPGFGFGKNDRQNLEILAKLDQFAELRRPLLVGLSRKRTLGSLTGRAAKDRLAAGLAAAVIAVQQGARIVRTHDVAATVDALAVVNALMESGKKQ